MRWLMQTIKRWLVSSPLQICECGMELQEICDAENSMDGCPYYRDMGLFDERRA